MSGCCQSLQLIVNWFAFRLAGFVPFARHSGQTLVVRLVDFVFRGRDSASPGFEMLLEWNHGRAHGAYSYC